MLGLATSHWHIGSPATARPLLKKPLTSSKRRQATRKLQAQLSRPGPSQPGLDIGCPNAAQTHREQPQPRPHVRVVPGAAQTHEKPPAARARTHKASLAIIEASCCRGHHQSYYGRLCRH